MGVDHYKVTQLINCMFMTAALQPRSTALNAALVAVGILCM